MRTFQRLLFVVLAVAAAGCGSPAARLVGTWEMDTGATPAGDSGSFEDKLKSAFASLLKVTIEFKPEGQLTFRVSAMGRANETSGTWEYLKTENGVMLLEVKHEGQSSSTVARVKMIDNDHFELSPPEGGEMFPGQSKEPLKFKRVIEPASK